MRIHQLRCDGNAANRPITSTISGGGPVRSANGPPSSHHRRRPAATAAMLLLILLVGAVVGIMFAGGDRYYNHQQRAVAAVHQRPSLATPPAHDESAGLLSADVPPSTAVNRHDHDEEDAPTSVVSSQHRPTLSPEGEQALQNAVVDAIDQERRGLRERLWQRRQAHAARHSIAGVRACFVTLMRHSDVGVRRLHRLLVNVRQRMPAMAGRYPFVAFHEGEASSTAIARSLLLREVEFTEGLHEALYGGSVWSHQQEMRRAGVVAEADAHRHDAVLMDAQNASTLSGALLAAVDRDDAAALRFLLRKFVFPKTTLHPNAKLRASDRMRWSFDAGDMSGVEFVPLQPDDFGRVPDHIRKGPWPYPQSSWWGVSYRHMCRFFAIRIFFTPFFQEQRFDYYMRLDTDSFILATPLKAVVPVNHTRVVGGGGVNNEATTAAVGAVEEIDYFLEMHVRNALYGFAMLHPQTIAQFMESLYETYDLFLTHENQDKYIVDAVVERNRGMVGRSTNAPLLQPLSPLPFPRRDGVHFWDNFEVVDLTVFRQKGTYDAQLKQRRELLKTELAKRAEQQLAGGGSIAAPHPDDPAVGLYPNQWHISDFDVLTNGGPMEQQQQQRDGGGREQLEAVVVDAAMGWLNCCTTSTVKSSSSSSRSSLNWRAFVAQPMRTGAVVSEEDLLQAVRHAVADPTAVVQRAQVVLRRRYDAAVRAHNERLRRVQSWFSLVETQGGLYYHRWGDAELRTLTVALFFEPKEVVWCASLPYQHYFNFHCPSKVPLLRGGDGGAAALNREVEACEYEARQGYGQDNKQRGTARMQPAEGSHYNAAFEKARASSDAGWRSV